LIATAETGSGKTVSYLLPILDRLYREATTGLNAVILAPTRELAAQIGHEFRLLTRKSHLTVTVITGGEPMERQLRELRAGVRVLVACPGRFIDHLERGTVSLDRVTTVVIDEADRLLDMGFMPQLRRIMRMMPKERQTMMFSATMDSGVERAAREFLTRPRRVGVGAVAAPPSSIRQIVYPVKLDEKMAMLLEILKRDDVASALIFTRTKVRADRVVKVLTRNRIRAAVIHGDRSQNQRTTALAGFRAGKYRILVATDIAARGLDIPDVSHVINFDLPEESENYIHRIGRTARMGRSGEALSLVTPEERQYLGHIERVLGKKLERSQLPGFESPEIMPSKPVTLFSSSHLRRSTSRQRVRAY